MKRITQYGKLSEQLRQAWSQLFCVMHITENFKSEMDKRITKFEVILEQLKPLAAHNLAYIRHCEREERNLELSKKWISNAWDLFLTYNHADKKAILSDFIYCYGDIKREFVLPKENVPLLIEELKAGEVLVKQLDPERQEDVKRVTEANVYYHQAYRMLHTETLKRKISSMCSVKERLTLYRISENLEVLCNVFLSVDKKKQQKIAEAKMIEQRRRTFEEQNIVEITNFRCDYAIWTSNYEYQKLDEINISDESFDNYRKWNLSVRASLDGFLTRAKKVRLYEDEQNIQELINQHQKEFLQARAIYEDFQKREEKKRQEDLKEKREERQKLLDAKRKAHTDSKYISGSIATQKTTSPVDALCKAAEQLISRCTNSIDYKSLNKDELCKWTLTLKMQLDKIKNFVAEITEDTPENRQTILRLAQCQKPLSELYNKYNSRYIDTPETKRRLSKAEIRAKDYDQLKIFMWGKRLFPDKMNKDDSWYENESRLVAVPYQEDIQTYLKNYGFKIRNGREARIEIEGKEDTDEWGWLCLANTFLPFCVRFIKTLSNETTLYHFYTFNVVTSKYAYDFDEAITDRIYWLNDKGVL